MGPKENSMADTDITVFPNGPLRISGDFVIKDGQGKSFDLSGRTAISLCRCGHSENKPFCDGSHGRTGFQSVVEARDLPPPVPKRSEEHTSELQSPCNLVCRLLLEKKKQRISFVNIDFNEIQRKFA